MAIGDSFTFGEGVGDEETFAHRLGQRLAPGGSLRGQRVEVLNLGVHGYGTDQQYLRLVAEGLPRQPDLVLLGMYLPDVQRNGLGFRDYAKPMFGWGDDGSLQLQGVPVPTPAELVIEPTGFWRSRLWGMLRLQTGRVARYVNDPTGATDPDLQLTVKILDLIAETCRRQRVGLLVVVIPKRLEETARVEETVISDWGASRDVPMVNMRRVLWALPEADRRRQYDRGQVGHWTAEAHDRCAAVLVEPVEKLLAPAPNRS